jgi:predicted TIM-barrel enzyme
MAQETAYRGKADGLIVTGPVTGSPAKENDVAQARKAVPDRLLLVGSGVAESNARELLQYADGAIVGTSLKTGGVVTNPLEPARVKGIAKVIHGL